MSLLEQMESVNPSERIILTYDAWCKLMNDVEALERVARATYAYDYCMDDDLERKKLLLLEMRNALRDAEHLLGFVTTGA